MILVTTASIALWYAAWSVLTLERNYRRAKTMGIPLIRVLVDPLNIPWQVIEPHFWAVVDYFDISLPKTTILLRRGWHFQVKSAMHEELGPIWAFVTPKDIHVQVCDSEALHDIYARRADFLRPREFYQLLAAYGPCVSTATPVEWGRQRKIVAAPFMNESIIADVWNESIHQTEQMIEVWTDPKRRIRVAKDTRTLSLNVMAAIGFRQSFGFRDSEQNSADVSKGFSYREALQTVLDNAILVMVVGRKHLRYPWLPGWIRNVGSAADAFQMHMEKMLANEMALINRGDKGSGTIMTSFVRALKSKQLSAEEIYGNTFVINFAGHDTTANSLAFAVLLLAAAPDIQQWIADEIQLVVGKETTASWDYDKLFPQLVRCRAILLETLRPFPPIMSLPKWTNDQPQMLNVHGKAVVLPPRTGVFPSVLGTHTYSPYWPDPLSWNPRRWITPGPQEQTITPRRNSYFPWSGGLQICPGQKFSQVEFVAVLARLLQRHRLRPLSKVGENWEATQERFRKVANDCDALMILRVRDADQVQVVCDLFE